MASITLRDVTFGFGGHPLLDAACASIESGERVALVGRNGAGKSTLLRLFAGELLPESGEIRRMPGLRTGRLVQAVPVGTRGTVFDVVAGGLGPLGDAVATYHRASISPPATADEERALAAAEARLHAENGWTWFHRVEQVITRLDLDADADVALLSAGITRRTLLARTLVEDPDVLLLDEPTNHLDIDSIRWLEGFLSSLDRTIVFITHDRAFVQAVATRILDLDRGRLQSYECDWKTYVARKEEALEVEEEQARTFDKKLAEEEVWIRKGVKERRKRNMGRVRELLKLREERRDRRDRVGGARIIAQEAERSGRLVIEATNLSFSYGDRPIVRDLSLTIQRGDRVGLLGANGVGKTTLLRLLLGEIPPDAGRLRHGTRLEVAYFDQLHATLDDAKSVADNVAGGADTVVVNGQARHVIGYLQDFLFTPIECRSLVSNLSGGERSRLLLARLFTRPSNVVVLDEPTNDLDAETLELLEELLLGYSGTVIVVSHDRAFLDNVVTSTIAFEGQGVVREYVGGYTDWLRQRSADADTPSTASRSENSKSGRASQSASVSSGLRKLTYMEQRELEKLPDAIDALETEKRQILASMESPDFYREPRSIVDAASRRLEALGAELETLLARWTELEERSTAAGS
jgi:ATP-binding cassette subfamily F protein uup